MTDLILIHKAIDANFHCFRKGMPGYQKPLRAIEYNKTSYEDPIKLEKDGKDVSVWTTLPIVMAIGFSDAFGIHRDDAMDLWLIDTDEEYDYKLMLYHMCLEKALKTYANKLSTGKIDDEGAYRFFVKYNLVNNYINFHRPKEFFSKKNLLLS